VKTLRRSTAPGHGRNLDRYKQTFDRDTDPYVERRKPAGPAACPDCGAVFFRGRWTWRTPSARAKPHTCPACQRIKDKVPAAFLTLRGRFVDAHAREILDLVQNYEERERAERPLKRIMSTARHDDAIEFNFTDAHLARGIGDALQHAYQGELAYEYTKGEVMLRVDWSRND